MITLLNFYSRAAMTPSGTLPLPPPPPILPFAAAAATAGASPPPSAPSLPLSMTPTWESLQETTARLLFMAVKWVKCLVPFQTLSTKDQVCI